MVYFVKNNYTKQNLLTFQHMFMTKKNTNLGNPSIYFFSIVPSSDVLRQNGTTVWYMIQEHEKPIVEEDVSQRLTESSTTSSPDLMEFERYMKKFF